MRRFKNEAVQRHHTKNHRSGAQMVELADEGDMVREDAGCGVLFGVMRDSAFKIQRLAEEERESHMRKGWWRRDDAGSRPGQR